MSAAFIFWTLKKAAAAEELSMKKNLGKKRLKIWCDVRASFSILWHGFAFLKDCGIFWKKGTHISLWYIFLVHPHVLKKPQRFNLLLLTNFCKVWFKKDALLDFIFKSIRYIPLSPFLPQNLSPMFRHLGCCCCWCRSPSLQGSCL